MGGTGRLSRDALLLGVMLAALAAGVVLRGRRHRSRLRAARRLLAAGVVTGLLETLSVGTGARGAEGILRRTRSALQRRRRGAASRTPAPPAPELAAVLPLRGPEAASRIARPGQVRLHGGVGASRKPS